MQAYTDQLSSLAQKIPDSVSEQELSLLEEIASEFQHILKEVHNHDARYKRNTQYYYSRVREIESALFEGKYGRDEKQRKHACRKARQELASGIEALATLIRDTSTSSGPGH